MKLEKLLDKFGMRGITYGPRTGGKALLSLDEQLAVIGITWKELPVGFHILFVECLSDRDSAREPYQPKAIEALCLTAMAEATQQLGQLCPECNGAGKVTNKHRVTRKCPCCKEDRIEWTPETRFALFCQKLPITYSRFKRYSTVLEKLVEWLTG